MNPVSKYHKDEPDTLRRMGDGDHAKSSSEQWMPRIDHFNLIGCLDRSDGLAQTCSIKMCSLLTECQSWPMRSRMPGATTKKCLTIAGKLASM